MYAKIRRPDDPGAIKIEDKYILVESRWVGRTETENCQSTGGDIRERKKVSFERQQDVNWSTDILYII